MHIVISVKKKTHNYFEAKLTDHKYSDVWLEKTSITWDVSEIGF